MSSSIDVVISAIDRLSPVLDNIRNNTSTLSLSSRALANGFSMAFDTAVKGASAFKDAMVQAIDTQTDNIQATASFISIGGQTYEQAAASVDKLNEKMARMAGSLPGTTDDFTRNAKKVIDDFMLGYGGDVDKAIEKTAEFTKGFTLLAKNTQGVNSAQIADGLSKLMAGEFNPDDTEFFRNNPLFSRLLQQRLDEMGASLDQLDFQTRADLLTDTLKKAVPKETIKKLQNSASGFIEDLKTKLFDPTVGLFSFSRKLKVDGEKTSVVDEFTKTLNLLFGEDGLFSRVSNALGIDFDPMENITRFIQRINKFLEGFDIDLSSINVDIDTGAIAGFVNESVSKITDFIGNVDAGSMAESVSGYVNEAVSKARDFIGNLDWGAIGEGLSELLFKVLEFISSYIANFDYGNLFNTLQELVLGIREGLISFFNDIGSRINERIDGWLNKVLEKVRPVIRDEASKISNAVKDFIMGIMDKIKEWVANIKDSIQLPSLSFGGGSSSPSSSPDVSASTSTNDSKKVNPVKAVPSTTDKPKSANDNQFTSFNPTFNISGVVSQEVVDQITASLNAEWNKMQMSTL